jgi:hypothetical protein
MVTKRPESPSEENRAQTGTEIGEIVEEIVRLDA